MLMPEIIISKEPVGYEEAIDIMAQRLDLIKQGLAGELLWFLEHPPLITLGVRGQAHDIISSKFPVYKTSRGGQATYHGPGQLVVYIMLDLNQRTRDLRAYVANLETMIIKALASFGLQAMRREGRVGVWVDDPGHPSGEAKIAAIGVRVSKWVTYHGISLNISPNLAHYASLIPCGLAEYGVTSMKARGVTASRDDVEQQLIDAFVATFNQT